MVCERSKKVEPKWAPVLRQLPKGQVEQGESLETAALREVTEETGFRVTILGAAGSTGWTYERDGSEIRENVHYFLMTPHSMETEQRDAEFDAIHWMAIDDAIRLLSYPEEKNVLEQVRLHWSGDATLFTIF